MALKEEDIQLFEWLNNAAINGTLGLVECRDAKTGEYRAVLTSIDWDEASQTHIVRPLGHLVQDATEVYSDPKDAHAVKVDDEGVMETTISAKTIRPTH